MKPLRLAFALVAALTLAACETKAPVQKLAEISFADKKPIMLDVAQLEIVSEFQAPGKKPNIEHLMPVSPENATIRWVQDRLKPMGKTGTARVVIKDAKVLEVSLKTDQGFTGLFKQEQAERYDAALDVAIVILDGRSMPVADVIARATRTRTVPEGVTVNDREREWHGLSEALVRDIDAQMDGLIRAYFARWVM